MNWEEWWTYDGISGPQFWGVINPEWRLCNEGRLQSPIDLDPSRILYDPGLPDLDVREEPPIGGSQGILVTGTELLAPISLRSKYCCSND